MLLPGAIASLLVVCCLIAGVAHAGARRRVVLVRPDSELLRSVAISLSSWDIDVVATEASPPPASSPGTEESAADIAQRSQADVVSWITESEPPAALWTYDVETGRLASSVLASGAPFDGPAAAAVALSLKALLRSSTVAPTNERLDSPAPDLPPPSPLRIEAEAGARVWPSETAEARGGVGVSIWPRPFDEHLGVGIAISTGPGTHLQTPAIDAHFSDVSLSSSLRSRVQLGSHFALEPALAGTVHWTTFDGTVKNDGPFESSRVDPSIDVAVTADASFGVLRVGLRASFGVLLLYQRYLVGDETVLPANPFVGDLMLRLSAGVF